MPLTDVRIHLAWLLFGLTVALSATQVTLLAMSSGAMLARQTVEDGFPLVTLGMVAASGVGVLIVSRYPRHRIGWLFLVGQLGTAFGLTAQTYGFGAMTGDFGTPETGRAAIWLSLQFGGAFALSLMAVLFLLAPDGRLPSHRWRWAVAAVGVGLALHASALATVRPELLDENGRAVRAPQIAGWLSIAGGLIISVAMIAGFLAVWTRLRRATGDERKQLRWVAGAAAGLAVSVPLGIVVQILGGEPWLATLPLMAAYLCVPILIGIAILRFRLYDIDVILNRAIVLAALTAFVTAGYIIVVVLVSRVVDAPADGAFWPSLLATVVVALGFQPLRRRLERFADRVVYGAQAAPYEALADFSDGLRASPSLGETLPRVAEAIGRSVGALQTEISIGEAGRVALRASWPEPTTAGPGVTIRVMDEAEDLGAIVVTMPPGRALRPGERRLLVDLAAQLGSAVRTFQLESELATQVDRLAAQADELSSSRIRLVAAQEAERRRFEAAIAREVQPYLTRLPPELAALGSCVVPRGDWPRDDVERMIRDTTAALEALRGLTRGVFPAQLSHRGLEAALGTHLEQLNRGESLRVDRVSDGRRFDAQIESAVYFCVVELMRDMPGPVQLTLSGDDTTLKLVIMGRGPIDSDGTRYVTDRVEALGGTLRTARTQDVVTVVMTIPLDPGVDRAQPAAETVTAET